MALILSIETATNVCSVAIHKEGKLLANQSLHIAQSHSGLLVPVIQTLLNNCDLQKDQLEAVALSKGPGSYTGLRIGTSTAKGLCQALEIPLIGVNTLEAMAAQVTQFANQADILCPMLDARRMEVYCMLQNKKGETIQETQPVIIEESSFNDLLDSNKMYFFGNGAEKCKAVIQSKNAVFINDVEPDAITVGRLAYQRYIKNQFEDLAYFNPFYLKDFRVTKPKAK
ncbi:tRNA (adenosine(37)-N6)-threonylcarbamoyltransferase complex dimerization subunit type 1 TsaB [Fulvivirga sp. RKSG066]|uniref:tRNA (adenosine(37)-N6)-threonylcarbamoyltransferase complex dimerization subunit type 1 TsaB n=1 Tax=Fulvivirga aurantia TaxID=2529383 RepID=UPI0012BD493C|nr:tRNA (adenosine(37)-N6)-threonylcarbamoyltransferase complex dimerization subunit type 1 TsaB [Fulvivirga aurantia]MTI20763.1 tRNA (adenosine(37)-N6)-threonylcarbamoyltransferase complex dimerization subunit type 1 TsaB [Fulvivirga aurantia]